MLVLASKGVAVFGDCLSCDLACFWYNGSIFCLHCFVVKMFKYHSVDNIKFKILYGAVSLYLAGTRKIKACNFDW